MALELCKELLGNELKWETFRAPRFYDLNHFITTALFSGKMLKLFWNYFAWLDEGLRFSPIIK